MPADTLTLPDRRYATALLPEGQVSSVWLIPLLVYPLGVDKADEVSKASMSPVSSLLMDSSNWFGEFPVWPDLARVTQLCPPEASPPKPRKAWP